MVSSSKNNQFKANLLNVIVCPTLNQMVLSKDKWKLQIQKMQTHQQGSGSLIRKKPVMFTKNKNNKKKNKIKFRGI